MSAITTASNVDNQETSAPPFMDVAPPPSSHSWNQSDLTAPEYAIFVLLLACVVLFAVQGWTVPRAPSNRSAKPAPELVDIRPTSTEVAE